MIKKLINWLLMVIIMAVPAGAAFALPGEQEQMIKQEVIVGYFDVWKGSDWLDTNNDGDRDKPGQTGKLTKPFNYSAAEKLNEWQITRVEVQYPFSEEEFTTAGGRHYGPDGKPNQMDWIDFKRDYLNYLPQNLTAQIVNQNLPAGTASVQWGLDLPVDPQGSALDLKKSENRQYIGYEPANIGSMVEGWRWYLPAIITWYGVPKAAPVNCVASAIDPGVSGTATPNQKYDGTVSFKYFGDQPVQDVPIGVFNGKYQAVLKDAAGNAVTTADFNPGEKKTFNFIWTAPPEGSATLTGVINVAPLPDLFEETTKDDNKVSATVNTVPPCTDIAITSMGADSPGVTSGGKITIFFNVKRANDGPQGPVPVKVTLKSAAGNRTWDITLDRGQSRVMEATFTLTKESSGTVKFTAEAWPQGVEDCKPGNNRATFDVYVEAPLNLPEVKDEGTKVRIID